jgi:cytochrome c biogenesis protein CcmG/thiol:disulfide interchange protein DsbE
LNTGRGPKNRHPRLSLLAATLLAAAGLAGCSGDEVSYYEAPDPPDYETVLADSPPRLAAIHDQGGEILEGGVEAFDRRLGSLSGFPVVVNVWASWCGPCREEFPLLMEESAEWGREVAFLGVDSQDSPDAARTFLKEFQVPYPSYSDPDEAIAKSIGASAGLPMTLFFDRSGEKAHTKFGPYRSEDEFRQDLARVFPPAGA